MHPLLRESLQELVGVSETSIHEGLAAARGSGHWGAGSGAWAAGMDRQEALIQGLQVGGSGCQGGGDSRATGMDPPGQSS